VLVTGGARGITAQVAIELAQKYQCRLELVGRSPLPKSEEAADTREARDLKGLRKALIARGGMQPAEVEAACRVILSARQIKMTLEAIREAGSDVVYHTADVRNDEVFGAVIDSIYARHDRLDGVLHGAGVIEDKLLKHKTAESFDRVFDTKVEGAITLTEHLREDVDFVVFFSSISGAFGNRGQVAYAAANDALDKLAVSLNERLKGRVVSINWGPWAGTGMVDETLEQEYARRGIGLIDPSGGVESFVQELAGGGESDAQVILMKAEPKSLQ
jgi:NAD(P)-dependent dehydrogenase (short-subunit alcohol dehydrogenase family)